jgi:myosin heavy subunit
MGVGNYFSATHLIPGYSLTIIHFRLAAEKLSLYDQKRSVTKRSVMGKVLLIVSIIITAASAALGFLNQKKLTTLGGEKAAAQQQVQQKTTELEQKTKDLKSTKESLTTVTAEKDQISAQVDTLKTELDKSKTDLKDLNTQITDKTAEVTRLTTDLQTKEDELVKLRSGTPQTTSEPSPELQAQLQEKETLITKLQGDLDSSRGQLEELRKRENDRRALKMRNGLEGRILAVNQAWNFVVLNLGDKNGVVSNAEMLIKRGAQLIGKVRVTSVEPATSIADIVSNSVPRGMSIQPGDNVIYQAVEE